MPKVPPLQFRREDIPDLSTGERTDRLLRGLNAFGAEAETLLNGGLTFANFRAFTKEITFTARDPWLAPSFANSWVNHGAGTSAGYRLDGARVHLRGLIKSGTAVNTVAFTLPAGYRPAALTHFDARAQGGAALVTVATTGEVTIAASSEYTGAPLTWTSLDGLSFDAAEPAVAANPVFPIRVKNELDVKPTHVLVTGAWISESGTETPVSLGSPAWTEAKGQVVIHALGNVFQSKKHRVTILVVAE